MAFKGLETSVTLDPIRVAFKGLETSKTRLAKRFG